MADRFIQPRGINCRNITNRTSLRGNTFKLPQMLFLILLAAMLIFSGCEGSSSSNSNSTGGASRPELDDYRPGTPAPLTASPLSSRGDSDGDAITITLEDGTDVLVPALEAPFEATLDRSSVDENLKGLVESIVDETGLLATGSMRRFVVKGSGDPSDLKPLITIPLHESGSINLDTITVLRVGDLQVDGEIVENYAALLPVYPDENGNLRFMDPMMPDSVVPIDTPAGASMQMNAKMQAAPASSSVLEWVGNTRYILLSFQDNLNWSERPKLVRMIPDPSASSSGYRRPAYPSEMAELSQKPICNLAILVHGHNEHEKGGYESATESEPWLFEYKRKVWDLMYKSFLEGETYGTEYPEECTAFYEFIYPSYRAIFTPVLDKSGWRHETLGESLGRLVEDEIHANSQLKAMIDNDMPFNLFVASHSQGGLVARAGLRHMPTPFLRNLEGFVSWGSPHRGASLYSLRYALEAGHDLIWQGVRIPLQNIGQSDLYQSGLSGFIIDTPGIRDLRWDASKKELLRLGEVFRENTSTGWERREIELPYGTRFFSSNLEIFNDTEGDWIGELLRDKYFLFHGTTSKMAPVEQVRSSWFPWSSTIWRFGMGTTSIEKGAFLNRMVMQPAHASSDGAVPLYSQTAVNFDPSVAGIRRIDMGDVDHEEFYGSEPPLRDSSTIEVGQWVARNTYHSFNLNTAASAGESRSCPSMEFEIRTVENMQRVEGRVLYPIYDNNGGLGNRISRIEARRGSADGEVVKALSIQHDENGIFSGQTSSANIPDDGVVIVAVFKDNSEIASRNAREDSSATIPFSESYQTESFPPGYGMVGQSRYTGPTIGTQYAISGSINGSINNSLQFRKTTSISRTQITLGLDVQSDKEIEIEATVSQSFDPWEWEWVDSSTHKIQASYQGPLDFHIRNLSSSADMDDISKAEVTPLENRGQYRLRFRFDPKTDFPDHNKFLISAEFPFTQKFYNYNDGQWQFSRDIESVLRPADLIIEIRDRR